MLDDEISAGLQLPSSFVQRVAKTASHWYKRYNVAKRSGGHRTICHPARELKAIQRWLVATYVAPLPVHPCAFGYRPGLGIRDHAMQHVKSKYLLRIDFESFFPSIMDADIATYIGARKEFFSEWKSEDIKLFTSLVCYERRLTIGAPSSPSLANALLEPFDAAVAGYARDRSVTYSRYADDLFFSSGAPCVLADFPAEIERICAVIPYPSKLRIHAEKTVHSSKKQHRRVTGLVLASDGTLSVGRRQKRQIRDQIFRLEKLSAEERHSLAGMLAFVKDVEPDFINRLVMKYTAAKVAAAQTASIVIGA